MPSGVIWCFVHMSSHMHCFTCIAVVTCRVSFLEDQDITLISLGEYDNKPHKNWAPVGEEIVLAALERIVNSVHYPVLITCSTGKHRTGEKLVFPA